jgi:hypothetical protein
MPLHSRLVVVRTSAYEFGMGDKSITTTVIWYVVRIQICQLFFVGETPQKITTQSWV